MMNTRILEDVLNLNDLEINKVKKQLQELHAQSKLESLIEKTSQYVPSIAPNILRHKSPNVRKYKTYAESLDGLVYLGMASTIKQAKEQQKKFYKNHE